MSFEFRIDDATINNTVEILKSNDINIDKSIIPKKAKNLKNIETVNVIYTKDFKNCKYYNDFKLDGNFFSYTEKNEKLYKKSNSRIAKYVKDFLKDCSFDSQYMKFSNVSENGKTKTLEISCYVKDYCVFDSRIVATVTGSALILSGAWHEPQTNSVISNSKTRKTSYITSILIDSCENEAFKNTKEIKKIEFGYLSGALYGNNGHITATALPYYRLTDDKDNVYYYDATDGTFNSSVSVSNSQ